MSMMPNANNIPSSTSIKQYYVNGKNGNSVVRVSFNPHSNVNSKNVSTHGGTPAITISIGTKNLNSNADVSQAIKDAVNDSSFNPDALVKNASANILNQAEDAIKAASTDVPNEEILGLLN